MYFGGGKKGQGGRGFEEKSSNPNMGESKEMGLILSNTKDKLEE